MSELHEIRDVNGVAHSHIIKEIIDVSPIKNDGMTGNYVVCGQKDAEHMCIQCRNSDGEEVMLLLPCSDRGMMGKCSNTFLLADAIQED